MKLIVFHLCLAASFVVLLPGCGGVMDSISTQHLEVHVVRHGVGNPREDLAVSIRMRDEASFSNPRMLIANNLGTCYATFKTLSGSAFTIIPPVGSVSARPPRPIYLITDGAKKYYISPNLPGAVYEWKEGGWYTTASIALR